MSKEKIVVIGAGSLQFGLGSVGSVIHSEILEGSTIYLHDNPNPGVMYLLPSSFFLSMTSPKY